MKIPSDLIDKYPATKKNQCVHWRSVCPTCEIRFTGVYTECSNCGEVRKRCKTSSLKGDDSCRNHQRARTYNVITMAAQQMLDGQLEAVLEGDDRDLSQEYQAARWLVGISFKSLSEDIKAGKIYSDDVKELLKNFKLLFELAEKRKRLEVGEQVTITFDGDTERLLEQRIKALIVCFSDVLTKHIPQESVRLAILSDLKEDSRLVGNVRNIIPMHKGKKVSSDYSN